MAIGNKRNYIRVSLIAAPLQAMVTTTPIFVLLDNDLRILPFIWMAITIPILGLWILNYRLQSIFQKYWKHYLISFSLVIGMSLVFRYFFLEDFRNLLNSLGFGVVNRTPPLVTTTTIALMNNAMVVVFQRLIRYREEQLAIANDLAEMRLLRADEQYRHLKSQVHPHFLFNSLNTLKILVKKNPEMAESYIVNLSNFLRVAIQDNQDELISCEKDLKLAMDYLAIQQMRFHDSIEIKNSLSNGTCNEGLLPVLTIQALVENAIKHNEISEDFPLLIHIYKEGDFLCVSNSLRKRPVSEELKSGSGLKNLNQRMQMLGCGEMLVEENENLFVVKLLPKK